MSREAISSGAFIAKPPADRSDLNRILDLAGRLMDRVCSDEDRETEDYPDNVIVFPGC